MSATDRRFLKVKCAGAGEDDEFLLYMNSKSEYNDLDSKPCKHAFEVEEYVAGVYFGGERYKMKRWRWPFTITCFTQGGCDATSVCLDCVLEARDRLLAGEGKVYQEHKGPYEDEKL